MEMHYPSGRLHVHRQRRRVIRTLLAHKILFTVFWAASFVSIIVWQRSAMNMLRFFRQPLPTQRSASMLKLHPRQPREDGVTLDTMAFERAVKAITERGGGRLNVQRGVWLTGPFNLTSHMTLFLAEGAVIRGIKGQSLIRRVLGIPRQPREAHGNL